jgi:hypothetical protein
MEGRPSVSGSNDERLDKYEEGLETLGRAANAVGDNIVDTTDLPEAWIAWSDEDNQPMIFTTRTESTWCIYKPWTWFNDDKVIIEKRPVPGLGRSFHKGEWDKYLAGEISNDFGGIGYIVGLGKTNAELIERGKELLRRNAAASLNEGLAAAGGEMFRGAAGVVGGASSWRSNADWEKIAQKKYDDWSRLGANDKKASLRAIEQFQREYVCGTGGKHLHQIRNVRNLGDNLYEIKTKQGARVYLDPAGNVIGFGNKNTQIKDINRLKVLLNK